MPINQAKISSDQWLRKIEGELAVDAYQTEKNIVVKAAVAGVKLEDLQISVNNDLLTIRGKREEQKEEEKRGYLCRECYWGTFSRSLVLPTDVRPDKIKAVLQDGILTITLPKTKKKITDISVEQR